MFKEAENKVNTINISFDTINKLSKIKFLITQIENNSLYIPTKEIEIIKQKLKNFLYEKNLKFWIENKKQKLITINALPEEIGNLLYENIWNKKTKVILVSGTISNNYNFDYIKNLLGLNIVEGNKKMSEIMKETPFNYKDNSILYMPRNFLFANYDDENYIAMLKNEIIDLINLTFGHTLILFSSYKFMKRMFFEVSRNISYPAFFVKKDNLQIVKKYKESKNGVLFAVGNMGEGVNFTGNLLSSLIIVKLPFPRPEIFKKDSNDFINEYAVLQMITELRQWIGRGIRREEDKTVFSILDSRAGINAKYYQHVISSLPEMNITNRKDDIYKFIL